MSVLDSPHAIGAVGIVSEWFCAGVGVVVVVVIVVVVPAIVVDVVVGKMTSLEEDSASKQEERATLSMEDMVLASRASLDDAAVFSE